MKRTNAFGPSVTHLLHRAGQCAGEIFQGEIQNGDLTPRQLAVLVTVGRNEGLSQTELVDRTGVDRSTMADIVRRMHHKGILRRRRTKKDARAYAVKLTREGHKMLRSVDPLAKKVDERILNALPASKRERFISQLRTIVGALGH